MTYRQIGKRLSADSGNRVRLAFAFGILLVVITLPLTAPSYLLSLISGGEPPTPLASWSVLMSVMLIGLLLIPWIIAALYLYGYRLYRSGLDACGFYQPHGRICLRRRWTLGFLIGLRPGVCGILIGVALWLSEEGGSLLLHLPLLLTALALSLAWMWISGGWFFLPYRMCRGDSVPAALRHSRRMLRGRREVYRGFLASFFGDGLLSVVTVGVWLVLHQLPNMIFAYFALADAVEGEGIQKETIQ